MSEQGFDPDDITELEGIFAQMISDNEDGFVMEFVISKLSAKELVSLWHECQLGNKSALRQCLIEYGKIMEELQIHLEMD